MCIYRAVCLYEDTVILNSAVSEMLADMKTISHCCCSRFHILYHLDGVHSKPFLCIALLFDIEEYNEVRNLLCEGNFLRELPSSVGCMCSLRTLDLSENSIRELPKELANVRTLEVRVKPVWRLQWSL